MHRKKGVILTEKLDAYFTEKYGASYFSKGKVEGEAKGEARAGRNMVLAVLRARFKRVPKDVEQAILAVTDLIALESWAAQAATCDTLDEFAEALR